MDNKISFKSLEFGTTTPGQMRELRAIGWSLAEIAKLMGLSEGTVRRASNKYETGIIKIRPINIADFAKTIGKSIG